MAVDGFAAKAPRADALLSLKIIILIRLTNFKFSAPAAADDDDDAIQDANRAMMDTENELAAKSIFFK